MLYNITNETLALISNGTKTKIIERTKIYNSSENINNIIERNCIQNGSSLEGRQKGSAYLLGTSYKPPIIISELAGIVLIPTHSIRNPKCIWINLKGVLNYEYCSPKQVVIEFINHQKLLLNISYAVFDKQLLRATRLDITLRVQKEKKYL